MTSLPPTGDLLLVLPFTPALLADPSPLLPLIYSAAKSVSGSATVLFSTPPPASSDHPDGQLYATLRSAPKAHWSALSHFLAQVYSALAAGQQAADNFLTEVEVRFDGELGEWQHKLPAVPQRVIVLDSYADLASRILETAGVTAPHHTVPSPALPQPGSLQPATSAPGYPVTALGGTFDHLHAAHKILLHIGLFVTEKRLFNGIISPELLASKSNAHLVQSLDQRIANVAAFLNRTGPGDTLVEVEEIKDALGPTRWDPTIKALVVSRETLNGGADINKVRKADNLEELTVLSIDVISSDIDGVADDTTFRTVNLASATDAQLKTEKFGSSGIRSWMSGHGINGPGGLASSPNVPRAGATIDPATGKPHQAGLTRAELEAKRAAEAAGSGGGLQSSPNVPRPGATLDPATGKPHQAGLTRAELEAKRAAEGANK
ncbi:hypothetical protein Q8F55_008917 [Vanrija albida]|uniref:Cytidyltransferase-like domain-containing protein n=1 Tax=Vanrija albida TaxID=181172 RepID=A0ABR3PSD5_9TREE